MVASSMTCGLSAARSQKFAAAILSHLQLRTSPTLESHIGSGSFVDEDFSTTRILYSRHPSNHAMERTATRRAFTLEMSKSLSLRAALALGGRRSSCSR